MSCSPRGNSHSRQQLCKHVANDAVALVVVATVVVVAANAVAVVVLAIDIAEMRRQLGTSCASLVAPAAVALALPCCTCAARQVGLPCCTLPCCCLPRCCLPCFYLYGRRQPALPDTLSGR